jgi:hypothetical protein
VVPEMDTTTQTDAFLERPPTPQFVPAKSGLDAATQIEEGEQQRSPVWRRAAPMGLPVRWGATLHMPRSSRLLALCRACRVLRCPACCMLC